MTTQESNNMLDNMKDFSESMKAFVGKDYPWPDWDEKLLGKPPQINMPKFQDKEAVAEFNQILSNISKMASIDTADELRSQLKALSGMPINIKDLKGNQNPDIPPLGTPIVEPKNKHLENLPEISFNPNVWGRYPVQGSKTQYDIATPEQMMIHELGHYAEMYKIYDTLNNHTNAPISPDEAAKNQFIQAVNEPHIVKDYENPAMSSIDPLYKKRDPDRYSEAHILFANKNGYPDVAEQDRATLIHSMQISGRAIPNQLNKPTTPTSSSSKVDINQDANYAATNTIFDLHFSQLVKEGITLSNLESLKLLTKQTTDNNAKNNTLQVVDILDKTYQQTRGSEFS